MSGFASHLSPTAEISRAQWLLLCLYLVTSVRSDHCYGVLRDGFLACITCRFPHPCRVFLNISSLGPWNGQSGFMGKSWFVDRGKGKYNCLLSLKCLLFTSSFCPCIVHSLAASCTLPAIWTPMPIYLFNMYVCAGCIRMHGYACVHGGWNWCLVTPLIVLHFIY